MAICLAGIAEAGCATAPIVAQAGQLCRDWVVQDRSKGDRLTSRTIQNMTASNTARVTWGCHPKKNEAASG
ncbi:MAG: hypothetical protein OEL78_01605 [Hyphomicrobiales bacterium]|nr:hypothetical protein [Hyphomicrobiales bacterium]